MQVTSSTALRPALSAAAMASLQRPDAAVSRINLDREVRHVEDGPPELPELTPGMIEREAQRARQIAARFMVSGMTTGSLAGAASIIAAMIASGQPVGGAGLPSLAQMKAAMAYIRTAPAELPDEIRAYEPVSIEA